MLCKNLGVIYIYIYLFYNFSISTQGGMSHLETTLEGLKKKPLTYPRQSLGYFGLKVFNCTEMRIILLLDGGQTEH